MHKVLGRDLCTGFLGWCRCRACRALMVLPVGWWRRCKLEKLLGGGAGIGLGIMGRDAGFEGVGGLEGRGRKVVERRG